MRTPIGGGAAIGAAKKNEIRKQFVVSFPAQMEKLEAATRS
jgi:hypothetical protein